MSCRVKRVWINLLCHVFNLYLIHVVKRRAISTVCLNFYFLGGGGDFAWPVLASPAIAARFILKSTSYFMVPFDYFIIFEISISKNLSLFVFTLPALYHHVVMLLVHD